MVDKAKKGPGRSGKGAAEAKRRHDRFSDMGKTARWANRGGGGPPEDKGFEHFPERMRWSRERLKMSRETLSEKTGYSPTSLSSYEDQRQAPRADRIEVLAEHLQVSPEWLFNGTGEAPAAVAEAA